MKQNETPVLNDYCLEYGIYGIPAVAEDFNENEYRYLRITDITDDGVLIPTDPKSISDKDAQKYLLSENDIVFARTGNSTGRTYFYDKRDGDLVFAGFLIKYKLDPEKINPKYLKYFTISKQYKNWVDNFSTGSTRGNMSAQDFGGMPLIVPRREQQNLLVKVLDSITDKIALNNLINTELEAMAKTIYNYWFVQFDFPDDEGKPYKASGGEMKWNEELKREIPVGWEVKPLENFGEFKNGINYEGDIVGDKVVRIVNVRDISNSTYFILKENLDEISLPEKDLLKYLVHENDILITRSGTPGATRLLHKDISDVIYCGFIIRFNVNEYQMKKYLFFKLKDIELALATKSAGTILKNVSQDTLKELQVAVPPKRVIENFNEKMNSIFESIYLRSRENQELKTFRDFLLPLLMNGQVKVK